MNQTSFDTNSGIFLLPEKKLISGIRELEWCNEELTTFDVFTVNDRDDPRIVALEEAIDEAFLALFDKESIEYQKFRRESLVDNACFSLAYPTPIHEIRQGLKAGMDDQRSKLTQAISALRLSLEVLQPEEKSSPAPTRRRPPVADAGNNEAMWDSPLARPTEGEAQTVLIINNGAETAKAAVTDFITKIDLVPRALEGATGAGVNYTLDDLRGAGFAVILVTPDDIRTLNDPNTSPDFQPCPAQEILFELGYLIGILGPDRVCALIVEDVEMKLEKFQLHVTPMDPAEGWKLDLAKMMKSAGVPIELNRAV